MDQDNNPNIATQEGHDDDLRDACIDVYAMLINISANPYCDYSFKRMAKTYCEGTLTNAEGRNSNMAGVEYSDLEQFFDELSVVERCDLVELASFAAKGNISEFTQLNL